MLFISILFRLSRFAIMMTDNLDYTNYFILYMCRYGCIVKKLNLQPWDFGFYLTMQHLEQVFSD